jgi:hypothetical protein
MQSPVEDSLDDCYPHEFLADKVEFCLQARNYYTNFSLKVDHGICCLFSDEMSDGVSQAGGNGLRGI